MLIGNMGRTKSSDSTMKSSARNERERPRQAKKKKSKSSSSSSSASGRSSGSESSDDEGTRRGNKGGNALLDSPVTIGQCSDSKGPQVRIGVFESCFLQNFRLSHFSSVII